MNPSFDMGVVDAMSENIKQRVKIWGEIRKLNTQVTLLISSFADHANAVDLLQSNQSLWDEIESMYKQEINLIEDVKTLIQDDSVLVEIELLRSDIQNSLRRVNGMKERLHQIVGAKPKEE